MLNSKYNFILWCSSNLEPHATKISGVKHPPGGKVGNLVFIPGVSSVALSGPDVLCHGLKLEYLLNYKYSDEIYLMEDSLYMAGVGCADVKCYEDSGNKYCNFVLENRHLLGSVLQVKEFIQANVTAAPTITKCDCGSETTYGIDTTLHAFWCSKIN